MAQPEGVVASCLPSSPPLFPERCFDQDVPSSPLPCSPSLIATLPNRKRQLSDYDSSLSSDPLFSEDASEADDITQYDGPRRKRMVKGPWWTKQSSVYNRRKERQLKASGSSTRNADSGVFMGSDMSEESIDNVLHSERNCQGPPAMHIARPDVRNTTLAQLIVRQCLESGKEVVDLSDLGLVQLTADTLNPLQQLIRQSHNDMTEPPSEDEFTVLTPDIQLFLAGNNLTRLPDELFLLSNITVLSLRNNELSELPTAVGRLTKLQELNIAGNNIQYLPWELLGESKTRKQIIARPNPLLEPAKIAGRFPSLDITQPFDHLSNVHCGPAFTSEWLQVARKQYSDHGALDLRVELELRLSLGRLLERQHLMDESAPKDNSNHGHEQLLYLASSDIQFFDVDGRASPVGDPSFRLTTAALERTETATGGQFAPSLFELATRAVQNNYYLDDVPDTMPAAVQTALNTAAQARQLGNRKCSTCGRPFVIARAQWVEYWYNGMSSQAHLTQETVLPFMRYACSWGCAEPSKMGSFRC